MSAPDHVDVLVIGAGASGAVIALTLAEAGLRVVCLDQGGWTEPAQHPHSGRDFVYRRFTDWNPEAAVRAGVDAYPVLGNQSQHDVGRWLRHTPMTEPGPLGVEFEKLPTDVASLNRIAQGLLIHSDWLSAYGLRPETLHSFNRMTLSVRQRFTAILECEKLSLALPGPPARGDLCSTAAL